MLPRWLFYVWAAFIAAGLVYHWYAYAHVSVFAYTRGIVFGVVATMLVINTMRFYRGQW